MHKLTSQKGRDRFGFHSWIILRCQGGGIEKYPQNIDILPFIDTDPNSSL